MKPGLLMLRVLLAVTVAVAPVRAQRQPQPNTRGALAGTQAGRSAQPPLQPPAANQLERVLQQAFSARNPKVTRTKVLELRSVAMGAGPYILLGWGIRADASFAGNFDDELFGVFVLDNNLSRIERTLDIFPTCRWADCIVSIESVSWDGSRIAVVGAGSYDDGPFRKIYSLKEMP